MATDAHFVAAQQGWFVISGQGVLEPIIAWRIRNGDERVIIDPVLCNSSEPHEEFAILRPDGTVQRSDGGAWPSKQRYLDHIKNATV